jgi:photosystem II stability/assembly factor-like uncharacterized protein
MSTEHSLPPRRDLPPGRLVERRRHLLAEIGEERRRQFSGRRVVGAVVALLAIGGAAFGAIEATTASGGQPGPSVPASLANSHVSAGGYAGSGTWALTASGLRLSTAGGGWQTVTPPVGEASTIAAAYFTDSSSGWVAMYGQPQSDGTVLSAYRTTDGGASWQSATVGSSNLFAPTNPTWLSFANQSDGWLEAQTVSSSNFSNANLYRTTDGGATWTALQIPIAGPITFVSAEDGFVSGGATGGALYATHDAGASWHAVTLPGSPTGEIYGPVFSTSTDGIVSVTAPSNAGASTEVYRTTDGGVSWTGPETVTAAADLGGATPVASIQDGWLAAIGRGGLFARLQGAAGTASTFTASGLPSGDLGQLVQLDFPSGTQTGLALFAGGACQGYKTDCSQFSALYTTSDGGSTWSQLTP